MRIVHVCRVGWPRVGGMERFVHGLARTQVGDGHDVRVVTLDRLHSADPRLVDGVHEGVVYDRVRGLGPGRYPVAWGLRTAVGRPDIVHAHGLDGLTDQAVRLGVPVGVSTHGGYFHTRRQWALKQVWLRTVTRRTLQRAGAVWFTSEADRQRLSAAQVPGEVLANGVDTGRFVGVRAPQAGRWLMLGRVQAHKGLADLVRWLPELDVTLHVVGEVVDAAHVAKQIRRMERSGHADRLVIHGALSDAEVREQLMRAEVVVAPSRSEGFGIAVVEAMGAGVPVVVSSGTALEERVAVGGGWAVDFVADDAGERLRRLVGGEHTEVGKRAQTVAARFGWDQVKTLWNDAYRRLLTPR